MPQKSLKCEESGALKRKKREQVTFIKTQKKIQCPGLSK